MALHGGRSGSMDWQCRRRAGGAERASIHRRCRAATGCGRRRGPFAARVVVCHVTAPARHGPPGGPVGRAKGLLDALHDNRRSGPFYRDLGASPPLVNDDPTHVGVLAVEAIPGYLRTRYLIGTEFRVNGRLVASVPVHVTAPNDIAGSPDENTRISAARLQYGKAVRGPSRGVRAGLPDRTSVMPGAEAVHRARTLRRRIPSSVGDRRINARCHRAGLITGGDFEPGRSCGGRIGSRDCLAAELGLVSPNIHSPDCTGPRIKGRGWSAQPEVARERFDTGRPSTSWGLRPSASFPPGARTAWAWCTRQLSSCAARAAIVRWRARESPS